MTRPSITALAASLIVLSSGCATGAEEGIWLVRLTPTGVFRADVTCTHNFKGAECDADDDGGSDDWSEDETASQPDIVLFAQVTTLADGQTVMVLGDTVLEGTIDGETWKLDRTRDDGQTETVSHDEADYAFDWAEHQTVHASLEARTAKEGVGGTLSVGMDSLETWREADEWEGLGAGFFFGRIPSDRYLSKKRHAAENDSDEDDCGGRMCELDLETTLVVDIDIRMERTDLTPEELALVVPAQDLSLLGLMYVPGTGGYFDSSDFVDPSTYDDSTYSSYYY